MAAKAVANKTKENKSFVEKTGKFFRGVWSELKKVHWPNRKQLVTYTGVVLAATLMVAALIWVADSILSFLLDFIL
ncbi:preprotein translocase subunit SecE [Metallumcola ferriviriculae]|uniref:Protein translocase subunit SecE n=1 Tax=Metallumcola ferriviriculae TaxID=3039180 RepID=A0AAU0UGL6_9FIRM|nr:preprotein translocase subunit SecE [Desulfitibacteraceae bacterium MK1]